MSLGHGDVPMLVGESPVGLSSLRQDVCVESIFMRARAWRFDQTGVDRATLWRNIFSSGN